MIKFSDLKLDPKVLKAVVEAGYETPTPIQEQAIPFALEGRDVLGIAQTGTGKTASFTLPLITRLGRGRARARMPRSLVLAPTRELAAQVAENFDTYAKYTKLTKALLIGGVAFGEQDKLIDRGVDVLIATPGRLLDHFERGKLLLTGVEVMVVDEADRMLDMGFIPDIERIFSLTPFTRQTFFYSATMAPEIERITNTFLSNPARVEVARQATTSATIEQALIELTPSRKDRTAAEKRDLLRALIAQEGDSCTNAIIFCNRKVDVDVVAKSLKKYGLDAAPIHGDLDQSMRTRTLDGFREGKLRYLVASDVAARGLDVPSVSHVFNFDVPSHAEDYVHRIGRTGRAGRLGKAFTLSTPSDAKYLEAIEHMLQSALPRGVSPLSQRAVAEAPAAPQATPAQAAPARAAPSRAAAPAPAAPDAAATDAAESPAPRGRRTRTRGGKADNRVREAADAPPAMPDAGTHSAAIVPAAQQAAVPAAKRGRVALAEKPDATAATAPAAAAAAAPVVPENTRADRPQAALVTDLQGRRRGGRRDNDDRAPRQQGAGSGSGGQVVGMGDHVPEFLLREFRQS